MPDLACDLMSLSPKMTNWFPWTLLSGSPMKGERLDVEALAALIQAYQPAKFVVETADDVQEGSPAGGPFAFTVPADRIR